MISQSITSSIDLNDQLTGAYLYPAVGTPRAHIVIVHGIGEHTGRYNQLAMSFAQFGFSCLTFDLTGHGRHAVNKQGKARVSDFAADISRARYFTHDAINNDAPQILLGHSLGGALVLEHLMQDDAELAQHMPSAAIVSAPSIKAAFTPPAWQQIAARKLGSVLPNLTVNLGLTLNALSRDQQVVRDYQSDPLVHGKVSLGLGKDLLALCDRLAVAQEAIPCPTLVLHGNADQITSIEATRDFCSANTRCEFIELADTYHEIFNDTNRDQTFKRCIDWLSRQLATKQ